MRSRRYRIRFPSDNLSRLDQGKAWFHVATEDGEERIEFHDYAAIYKHPGLYEQLFYDRLKCNSPRKLSDLLHAVVLGDGGDPTRLRVLDVGAGNGMVGELLVGQGGGAGGRRRYHRRGRRGLLARSSRRLRRLLCGGSDEPGSGGARRSA